MIMEWEIEDHWTSEWGEQASSRASVCNWVSECVGETKDKYLTLNFDLLNLSNEI